MIGPEFVTFYFRRLFLTLRVCLDGRSALDYIRSYRAVKLGRNDSFPPKISRPAERNDNLGMKESQADFYDIYKAYMRTIHRYCLFRTNSYQDAEDLTAEVFIKLIKNRHKVENERTLAWLYAVAANLCINHYRRREKAKKISGEAYRSDIAAEPWEDIGVWSALEKLKPIERQAVFLRVVEDKSFSEVAELLNKREGAVKMLFYRAVENLSVLYQEENNDA